MSWTTEAGLVFDRQLLSWERSLMKLPQQDLQNATSYFRRSGSQTRALSECSSWFFPASLLLIARITDGLRHVSSVSARNIAIVPCHPVPFRCMTAVLCCQMNPVNGDSLFDIISLRGPVCAARRSRFHSAAHQDDSAGPKAGTLCRRDPGASRMTVSSIRTFSPWLGVAKLPAVVPATALGGHEFVPSTSGLGKE